jgi:hypothetical protein
MAEFAALMHPRAIKGRTSAIHAHTQAEAASEAVLFTQSPNPTIILEGSSIQTISFHSDRPFL